MKEAIITVTDMGVQGSTTAGIQEAIDALPPDGGTVYLPPGRYTLQRSVELRSNVRIRGEGPATILTRPAPVEGIPVTQPTDGSRTTIHVAHTTGLQIGDEIYVRDDQNKGWWSTHAIILAINGGRLDLKVLHGEAEYIFLPERNARITNWFPCFWLRKLNDVTIEHLTIDGGIKTHISRICDFVVAAVHSRGSENVRVANITVRNWPGDGIGLQGGRNGWVSGCLVENCAGHGYHPGTGITQSIWSDNVGQGNTRDGFYFCLRVTHTTVRGSLFVANDGHGIGGLTDPDQYNTVMGNICADNGMHGIDADKSIGNTIQGNICRSNSRSVAGKFAGIYLSGHRDCIVTGNICVDDKKCPTQLQGLIEKDQAGSNIVSDNLCSENTIGRKPASPLP